MDRYFEGEEFSVEEIRAAMRTEVMDGSIVPVAMGSNIQAQGAANLLSDIVRFFPSPDKKPCVGIKRSTNEMFEANYDFSKAKSAYVFKTMVDPFIGKYSFVKVCSGVLKGDDVLYNAGSDAEEKPGKLYVMSGNKPSEVSELFAGDIGAIAKLTNTRTGDTLSTKNTQVLFTKTDYSVPYTYMKYSVKNKGDEDKVSQALARMMAEDMTLKVVSDGENRQSLLYGMGDQHLEIVASKLAARYKVEITLEMPKVAFRETIRKNSDVGWTRPVRACQDEVRTVGRHERSIRVRGNGGRRRGAEELFPGRGKGPAGFRGEGTLGRISGGGRESRPLRWILPSGRFF